MADKSRKLLELIVSNIVSGYLMVNVSRKFTLTLRVRANVSTTKNESVYFQSNGKFRYFPY